MIKLSTLKWRSFIPALLLAVGLCMFSSAKAQDPVDSIPSSVDVRMVHGATADKLDIQVFFHNDGEFDGIFSSLVVTVRYDNASGSSLGFPSSTFCTAYQPTPEPVVVDNGTAYRTYTTAPQFRLDDACGSGIPANAWFTLFTIPVQGTACTAFTAGNDAYTAVNNLDLYLAMNGQDVSVSVIGGPLNAGVCALDCEGVLGGPALPGTACDDGDATTTGDVYDANCVCAGTSIFDCPVLQADIGDACDDGDPNSASSTVNADCNCVASAVVSKLSLPCGAEVLQVTYAEPGPNGGGTATAATRTIYTYTPDNAGGVPTYTGTVWPYVIVSGVFEVDAGISATVTVNPNGVLLVNGWPAYQYSGDASSTDVNGTYGPWFYFLPDGTRSQDACAGIYDCPVLQANIGDPCDDGDTNTGGDVVNASCVCAGQLIDCENNAGGTALPGTSCDDGDATTGNDVWSATCVCAGQLIDCENNAGGTALPGTACDDGDATTGNDVWSATCVCAGELIDCENNAGGTALPGTACDDGDATTGNDVWSATCVCAGELIDCEGTAGGTALPGTSCDDNDTTTGNDTWGANCVCAGELIDCEGTAGGTALPGTACDDNEPNTTGDVYDANCVCAGLLVDCEGTAGGTALPGTACDDNDPNTTGDVYDANCVCAGLLVDCEGTPGGTALPGTTCDDGDSGTGNDVYDANCVCAGQVIDCEGVIGGTALPGTTCDDGDAGTTGDVYDANCVCIGTPIGSECSGNQVVVNITTDDSPGSISWTIHNSSNVAIASGTPSQPNSLNSDTVCLGTTPESACYTLNLTDLFGDGITNGGWEIRTTTGKLLLRDDFANGTASPAQPPAMPGYGSGHSFCLPEGPARIASYSCGNFTNTMTGTVYADPVPGASQYQFEFTDPDAGFIRRIAEPHRYVHFLDMVTYPPVPGVHYFVRVRTDVAGPLHEAHFGAGCEVGMGVGQTVVCSHLIQAPAYGHSCNETRQFGRYGFIYAQPVPGADYYQFHIYNTAEEYDTIITRNTYILQLKWAGNPMHNGSTYTVEINVGVNGVESGFCPSSCTITIDNSVQLVAQQRMEAINGGADNEADLWPNPVREGQVNLQLTGLTGQDRQIGVAIFDVYGRQVLAKDFGNSGERFSTVLDLPGSMASGVYVVNITVNGKTMVQRLSVIR